MTTTRPVRSRGEAARSLTSACRAVHALGWMPATAGNLSVRTAGDDVVITASGIDKGAVTAADVVAVGPTGVVSATSAGRPSAETAVHLAIYRTTDAGAVVHAHPPYATTVAGLAGAPDATRLLPIGGYELVKAFGHGPGPIEVPIFANHVDVSRLADDVERWFAAWPHAIPALLIERHGVTTWGADLDEARIRLECVEALAQLLLLSGAVPTSASTIGELR